MPENAAHTHLSTARCVGRFLPFAIYSQTDSPQECQSNEKYHETKLFSCQRDHQGLHIRHEYPHPPSARLALGEQVGNADWRDGDFLFHGSYFTKCSIFNYFISSTFFILSLNPISYCRFKYINVYIF
jgi:hypothetical protein